MSLNEYPPEVLPCLRWLASLPPVGFTGSVPQEHVNGFAYCQALDLTEPGAGLAFARISPRGRLVLAQLAKAEAVRRERVEGPRGETTMPAAAKRKARAGADNPPPHSPLPEQAPYPVHDKAVHGAVKEIGEKLDKVGELLTPAPPAVALTDADRYILTVLDAHRGKALTFHRIEREAYRMNREDPQRIKRLSDSMIRQRVPVLVERGLVVRPPGTKKKGICITDDGHQALHLATGNPTEPQRKK